MSRSVRFLAIAYGLAMAAAAVWVWFRPRDGSFFSFDSRSDQWVFGGAASLALLVLSVALIGGRGLDFPGRAWIFGVVAVSATGMIPIFADVASEERHIVVQIVAETAIYIGVTLWLDRLLGGGMRAHGRSVVRIAALAACAAGACMVLSSLFLLASFGRSSWATGTAKGWEILAGKAHWVTADINAVVGLSDSEARFAWLQPAFLITGYAVYVISLAATIAIIIWLVTQRNAARPARVLPLAGMVLTVCSFWLYTDIFWGWRFEWATKSFAPLVAMLLWVAGPLLIITILLPIASGRYEPWRLRAVLLLQAPIAVFNYYVMFDYFGELKIPGLAMLMMGAQLESWACIVMLANCRAEVSSSIISQPALSTSPEDRERTNSLSPQARCHN